jgi:hypothetical protein
MRWRCNRITCVRPPSMLANRAQQDSQQLSKRTATTRHRFNNVRKTERNFDLSAFLLGCQLLLSKSPAWRQESEFDFPVTTLAFLLFYLVVLFCFVLFLTDRAVEDLGTR